MANLRIDIAIYRYTVRNLIKTECFLHLLKMLLGVCAMPTTSSNCEHAHDVQDFTPQDVTERLEAAKEQSRMRGVRFTP